MVDEYWANFLALVNYTCLTSEGIQDPFSFQFPRVTQASGMVVLTCFPPPTEGVRHKQSQTAAFIENQSFGIGTLYVAESRLSWMSDEGRGFSLEYPAISLHAISRDVNVFPEPCIYLMVEADFSVRSKRKAIDKAETNKVADDIAAFNITCSSSAANFTTNPIETCSKRADNAGTSDRTASEILGSPAQVGQQNGSGEEVDEIEEDDDEETKITEVRFVPQDISSNAIFQAMSDCQALHPNENDDMSDEEFGEGGDEFYTTADGVGYLSAEGQATLERISHNFDETGDGMAGSGRSNGNHMEDEEMEGQFDDI